MEQCFLPAPRLMYSSSLSYHQLAALVYLNGIDVPLVIGSQQMKENKTIVKF